MNRLSNNVCYYKKRAAKHAQNVQLKVEKVAIDVL